VAEVPGYGLVTGKAGARPEEFDPRDVPPAGTPEGPEGEEDAEFARGSLELAGISGPAVDSRVGVAGVNTLELVDAPTNSIGVPMIGEVGGTNERFETRVELSKGVLAWTAGATDVNGLIATGVMGFPARAGTPAALFTTVAVGVATALLTVLVDPRTGVRARVVGTSVATGRVGLTATEETGNNDEGTGVELWRVPGVVPFSVWPERVEGTATLEVGSLWATGLITLAPSDGAVLVLETGDETPLVLPVTVPTLVATEGCDEAAPGSSALTVEAGPFNALTATLGREDNCGAAAAETEGAFSSAMATATPNATANKTP
jgi:hypothetical protein